jgi:hypothetical protein
MGKQKCKYSSVTITGIYPTFAVYEIRWLMAICTAHECIARLHIPYYSFQYCCLFYTNVFREVPSSEVSQTKFVYLYHTFHACFVTCCYPCWFGHLNITAEWLRLKFGHLNSMTEWLRRKFGHLNSTAEWLRWKFGHLNGMTEWDENLVTWITRQNDWDENLITWIARQNDWDENLVTWIAWQNDWDENLVTWIARQNDWDENLVTWMAWQNEMKIWSPE